MDITLPQDSQALYYLASFGCDYSQSWCTIVEGPAPYAKCMEQIAHYKARLASCASAFLDVVCKHWQHWLDRVQAFVKETGKPELIFDVSVANWEVHLEWLRAQLKRTQAETEWAYKLVQLEQCFQNTMYGGTSDVDLVLLFDWAADRPERIANSEFISYFESKLISSFKGMLPTLSNDVPSQVSIPLCKYADNLKDYSVGELDAYTLDKLNVLPPWWTSEGPRAEHLANAHLFEDLKNFLLIEDVYAIHPAADIEEFEPSGVF